MVVFVNLIYMWSVVIHRKVIKRLKNLPKKIQLLAYQVVSEIEEDGPHCRNWPNFSKLGKNEYHCHLKKGHPTYVLCWRVENKRIKLIEVTYVGTHEKAPY